MGRTRGERLGLVEVTHCLLERPLSGEDDGEVDVCHVVLVCDAQGVTEE
jgi:hypothetical protein